MERINRDYYAATIEFRQAEFCEIGNILKISNISIDKISLSDISCNVMAIQLTHPPMALYTVTMVLLDLFSKSSPRLWMRCTALVVVFAGGVTHAQVATQTSSSTQEQYSALMAESNTAWITFQASLVNLTPEQRIVAVAGWTSAQQERRDQLATLEKQIASEIEASIPAHAPVDESETAVVAREAMTTLNDIVESAGNSQQAVADKAEFLATNAETLQWLDSELQGPPPPPPPAPPTDISQLPLGQQIERAFADLYQPGQTAEQQIDVVNQFLSLNRDTIDSASSNPTQPSAIIDP